MNQEPLLVLLLGLIEKQASRLAFTVSVPSHFSSMYRSGEWIFYSLEIEVSQILRLRFTEIVFYFLVLEVELILLSFLTSSTYSYYGLLAE